MTDHVTLPNAAFEHDRLHLAPPNGLQGGAYFSMLYYRDAPLYIQTPKCTSRHGVVPGKRPYIDLLFSNHDVPFLEWLEAMEASAVRLIHNKRNVWISSDIEKADIEAGFTSPVRPYKGGKHYLIRAHIQLAKHLAADLASSCSVFDENERPVPMDYIKPEHQMYAVLEFQGIKFTARSFQMDVALKQVLIVPNVPMFQACVIRRPSTTKEEPIPITPITTITTKEEPVTATTEETKEETKEETNEEPTEETKEETNEEPATITNEEPATITNEEPATITNEEPATITTNTTTTPTTQKETAYELQEINLDVLEDLEHAHLKLKNPTQVYYEMYRTAKQRAKELKKNAIAAYLTAKQIKSIHMLEDSESDSDSDNNSDFDSHNNGTNCK
jgi:hypothetical protein